ncbi:hypothetical protein V0M98_38600 (plasmid) [Pseudomonas silesiensis]|uniref:hypothetical protein n=1 Tax=Pseudomonas silesiensis TaxID=1853130 RepID=UPI0030CB67D0
MNITIMVTIFLLIVSGFITIIPGLEHAFESPLERLALVAVALWCSIPFGFVVNRVKRKVAIKLWQWLLAIVITGSGGAGLAVLTLKALSF